MLDIAIRTFSFPIGTRPCWDIILLKKKKFILLKEHPGRHNGAVTCK